MNDTSNAQKPFSRGETVWPHISAASKLFKDAHVLPQPPYKIESHTGDKVIFEGVPGSPAFDANIFITREHIYADFLPEKTQETAASLMSSSPTISESFPTIAASVMMSEIGPFDNPGKARTIARQLEKLHVSLHQAEMQALTTGTAFRDLAESYIELYTNYIEVLYRRVRQEQKDEKERKDQFNLILKHIRSGGEGRVLSRRKVEELLQALQSRVLDAKQLQELFPLKKEK